MRLRWNEVHAMAWTEQAFLPESPGLSVPDKVPLWETSEDRQWPLAKGLSSCPSSVNFFCHKEGNEALSWIYRPWKWIHLFIVRTFFTLFPNSLRMVMVDRKGAWTTAQSCLHTELSSLFPGSLSTISYKPFAAKGVWPQVITKGMWWFPAWETQCESHCNY